ncbi:metallophosphoesterase [Myxococcota bacterium]
MPRWLLFLLFFTLALLILGGTHYYFYRRLVVAPQLPPPWSAILRVTLIVLAFSFVLSFFIGRNLDVEVSRYLLYPIYVWLGVMLILFFALLSVDFVRGIVWIGTRFGDGGSGIVDPQRRVFLARVIAGAVVGTTVAVGAISLWRGLSRLAVKRIEVVLPRLPAAMDGFTIAQLSDLHLGPMRSGSWLREVVRRTNELEPDLVAITGDLADVSVEKFARETAVLRDLDARQGVFFVTGNHEYFYDLHGWLRYLGELGIRVLRNERVPIRRGEAAFDLAGVDDHEGGRLAPGHGADVSGAMRGRDPERAVVLLAHQPRAVKDAALHDVGLVLTGHTHGGQIWPWGCMVYLQQPYVRGLHEHDGTQLYVSEGTGFWGPPMRLGSTAEITLVTLRSPAHSE